MSQLSKQRVFPKIGLLMLLMSMSLSACVSINTGQTANNNQQNNPPVTKQPSAEKKVSLEEAASFNMTLGAQYLKKGKLEQGINKLNKAIEQQPTLALAHTYLGFAHEQLGEIEKAKQHYSTAIKLDSSDPVSLNNYGTFLCRQNELRESLPFFEKAAQNRRYQTPDAAYANAGVCARKIPDLIAAESYFRRAIGANPKYTDAYFHLADLSIEQNKIDDADGFYKDFIRMAPGSSNSPDMLWLGYRIEKAKGNFDKAGQYSLKLQREYPESEQTKKLLNR